MATEKMELETINKLYLELSQIATARTAREIALNEVAEAARDLHEFFHANVGENDDWPIAITVRGAITDDKETADLLIAKMNRLSKALKNTP